MEYTTEIINIVKIKEGFFIGDRIAGTTFEVIEQFKITHIINAAGNEIINQFESIGIKYLTLNWIENPKSILFDPKDEIADIIFTFIEDSYKNGEGLLVHSSKGQNRVCIVVIIYLIKKYNWTIQKCIDLLFSKKNDVFIPQYFLKQLNQFENRINQLTQIKKSFNWSEEQNKEDIEEYVMRNTYINGLRFKIKNNSTSKKNIKNNLKVGWADNLVNIDLQRDLFLIKDIKDVTSHINLKPMISCIKKKKNEENKNENDLENEKENINSNLDNNKLNNNNTLKIIENTHSIKNANIKNENNNDNYNEICLDGKLLQEIKGLTSNENLEKITFNNIIKPQKPINIINRIPNENVHNKITNNIKIKSSIESKNISGENTLKRNSSFDKSNQNQKKSVNLLNNKQSNVLLNNKGKNKKIKFANNYRQIDTNNLNNYFIQNPEFENKRVRTPDQLKKNNNIKKQNELMINPNKNKTNYFLNNNKKLKMMDYYSNNNNIEYNNILKSNLSDFQNKNIFQNKNQFLVSPINNYNPKQLNLHTPMRNSNSQNSILNRNRPLNNFNPSLMRKAKTPLFNRNGNLNNKPIKIQNNEFYKKPSTPDLTLKKSKDLEKLYKNQNIYLNMNHLKNKNNNNILKRPSTAPQKDKKNNNVNYNIVRNKKYLGTRLKRAPSPMLKSHNNNLYKTQKVNIEKLRDPSPLFKSNEIFKNKF